MNKIIGVEQTKKFAQEARIRTINGYVPVKDIKVVNEKENVWQGEIVKDTDQEESIGKDIFFSRSYKDDVEWDRHLNEYYFESVLDFPFYLIPKEKLLFVYEPPSTIIKPRIGKKSRRPLAGKQ